MTALSYGIGHGGCEAFLILGVTYISNIVISLMMQRGVQMSAEITAGIQSLAALPVTLFLLAGFERIVAMTLHTALSVLVFAAVRNGRSTWTSAWTRRRRAKTSLPKVGPIELEPAARASQSEG